MISGHVKRNIELERADISCEGQSIKIDSRSQRNGSVGNHLPRVCVRVCVRGHTWHSTCNTPAPDGPIWKKFIASRRLSGIYLYCSEFIIDAGFIIDANLPDLQGAATFLIGFYTVPHYPLFANCVVNLA